MELLILLVCIVLIFSIMKRFILPLFLICMGLGLIIGTIVFLIRWYIGNNVDIIDEEEY